jgi:hypothetical protein
MPPITRAAIEIRIGNATLVQKLDAIAAALVAVREAHRDTMNPRQWGAINRSLDSIAEAVLYDSRVELLLPADFEGQLEGGPIPS